MDTRWRKQALGTGHISRLLLPSALCSLLLMFACGTDPVARDLAGYLNQGVMNIAELEQKALESYASVTGSNYTSDESVYNALKHRVIPLYGRFLDGLRDISPETEEVRDLNLLYVQAAGRMYEGFKRKAEGIEQHEAEVVVAGNMMIEEARTQSEKWLNELSVLADKHGLKMQEGRQERSWREIFKTE